MLLNGLNRQARFNMGECKNDPGGYFIIDGVKSYCNTRNKADNMLYVLKDPVINIHMLLKLGRCQKM